MAASPNFSLFLRASLLLCGLAWTLPLLQPVHRFPLTAFYSEWLAFALGVAALAPLLLREAWRDARLPVIALAPLALIVVLGIHLALGRVPYPGQALAAGLYLSWAVLLVLLGQLLRRTVPLPSIATTLAWFLLAGGLIHALTGLAQHYAWHGPPLDWLVARKNAPVVHGNLGQANHYAAAIALGLASIAYLDARRVLNGALSACCAAPLLIALALSGSRSTWLYLCVLIALALWLWHLRREDESRRLARTVLWLPVAYIAAQWLVALPFLAPAEGPPMQTAADRLFETASGHIRLQLWGEAGRMFLAAPLLGSGFGQFAWQHFLQQAASGELTTPVLFNHAHNIVAQLAAEFGAAGTLIVVGAALAWGAALRGVRLDLQWWWLLALLSIIGLHSMLEYPLWYAYFLGMAALLLGLGAERCIAVRNAGAARGAVALLAAAGCFNLAAVMGPYRDFERLVFEASTTSARGAGGQDFAVALMRAHRDPLLTPYVELAMVLGADVDSAPLREQLELNTRAMRFAPLDVVVYRQAALLALAGERAAARIQLERALTVYAPQAATAVAEFEKLARRHPGEMTPLLELAAEKARPAARQR